MSATVDNGTVGGIEFEVFDLTKLITSDFVPGFYYSAGDTKGEQVEEPGTETIALEGPYATREEAAKAAHDFIIQALSGASEEE
jgi:hypothetical protein